MLFAYKLNIYEMCGIMNNGSKKKYIYIRLLIYFIVGYFFNLIMNQITLFNHYNIFIKSIYIIFILCIIDFIISDLLNFNLYLKFNFIVIIYILFLLVTLFYRPRLEQEIENPIYIFKWIKIIFQHDIVFYNIIGNILIFVPLGYLLVKMDFKTYINIIVFISPIILEVFQYTFYRGIFDIIDVFLNMTGILVGYLIIKVKGIYYERRKTKRRK